MKVRICGPRGPRLDSVRAEITTGEKLARNTRLTQ
jgi:hypothetical protein